MENIRYSKAFQIYETRYNDRTQQPDGKGTHHENQKGTLSEIWSLTTFSLKLLENL